jgi:hypothetical protein
MYIMFRYGKYFFELKSLSFSPSQWNTAALNLKGKSTSQPSRQAISHYKPSRHGPTITGGKD